jgi:hypothetical protein
MFQMLLPDFCTKSCRPDEVSGVSARLTPRADHFILPARFNYARDFALESERAEAKAAYAELPEKGAGAAAELAAVVLTRLELRLLCVFDAFCGS